MNEDTHGKKANKNKLKENKIRKIENTDGRLKVRQETRYNLLKQKLQVISKRENQGSCNLKTRRKMSSTNEWRKLIESGS